MHGRASGELSRHPAALDARAHGLSHSIDETDYYSHNVERAAEWRLCGVKHGCTFHEGWVSTRHSESVF